MSAFVKNYFGRLSSVSVELPGPQLPAIFDLKLFHDDNISRLYWTAGKTNLKNLTYGIYYGTTLDELLESKNLENCFCVCVWIEYILVFIF